MRKDVLVVKVHGEEEVFLVHYQAYFIKFTSSESRLIGVSDQIETCRLAFRIFVNILKQALEFGRIIGAEVHDVLIFKDFQWLIR